MFTNEECKQRNAFDGTSLLVQWLGLHASTAGGMGSIPGWGTKVPCAVWHGQKIFKNKKIKKKKNKFSPLKKKKKEMHLVYLLPPPIVQFVLKLPLNKLENK